MIAENIKTKISKFWILIVHIGRLCVRLYMSTFEELDQFLMLWTGWAGLPFRGFRRRHCVVRISLQRLDIGDGLRTIRSVRHHGPHGFWRHCNRQSGHCHQMQQRPSSRGRNRGRAALSQFRKFRNFRSFGSQAIFPKPIFGKDVFGDQSSHGTLI